MKFTDVFDLDAVRAALDTDGDGDISDEEIFERINFENTNAHIYIYSLILWITLVLIVFKIFEDKLYPHYTLFMTYLIFNSAQDIWEYAPFIVYFFMPTNIFYVIILHINNLIPTFLLLFYWYKFKITNIKFYISLTMSLFISILLFIYPEYPLIGLILIILYQIFT